MRPELLCDLVKKLAAANSYFAQNNNCVGQAGFTPTHKCAVAINMLAYGGPADALDDHLKMGESTVLLTLKKFVQTIIQVYGQEWLRPPTAEEMKHILQVNAARGFPGMLGSIDCMHWEWSSCPTGHHGMYKGHKGKPTLILEAVATEDLRIWHAFFGMPGSHNDINVLDRSPVFDNLANGCVPPVEFTVNGNDYHLGYYLADGIYLDWATLVKSIPAPANNKDGWFAERQEACRKDVERAFGVLQAKWKILHYPARLWKPSDLRDIMMACIILHNMIIADERGSDLPHIENREWPSPSDPPVNNIAEMMDAYTVIKNKETCYELRKDLVEHIWAMKGSSGQSAGDEK